MVCRYELFYAEYFYLFAVFSLLYYHFITAFILPHFSKNAQLLLGLFRQTEALAIASAFFNLNLQARMLHMRIYLHHQQIGT
jgi:hypothetical protein